MAFDKTAYDNEYTRTNYDRVILSVPKGRKADLKKEADMRGISVNRLIVEAVENYYKINLSKKD